MGFINNTSYILNAVLTKKGKEYLSKSSGNFAITKFALSDDEIDYALWNTAHPKGSNYYGAVLESTPMLEPCVDPEVVMKYKLFTMPVGTKTLPYITDITQLLKVTATDGTVNDSRLKSIQTDEGSWTLTETTINPTTVGADQSFQDENYSFLCLNMNVVDMRLGTLGTGEVFDDLPLGGAIYGEESGRLSTKLVGESITIKAKQMTFDRETSIIITGQKSGAIYVLRVQVTFDDQRASN